jgi:hypothetical protein
MPAASVKSTGHYLSSKRMTVLVEVKNGKILRCPRAVGKFKGQPLDNLREWMKKQGGFKEWELQD